MVFTGPGHRTLICYFYHFFQKALPGGFIGVDIFFTFSGILITALLIDEFVPASRNRLPRLSWSDAFTGLYRLCLYGLGRSCLLPFGPTDYMAGIGTQIAAVFGFVTNFFEMATGGSYESNFIPHLFLHTWSLALEVHYYVLWALLAWFWLKS